jgi:hypothetical protein
MRLLKIFGIMALVSGLGCLIMRWAKGGTRIPVQEIK